MDKLENTRRTNKTEPQRTDLARRRIIGGAAALPVVLTVSNASAQAVASQLQCRDKFNILPDEQNCVPEAMTQEPDFGTLVPPEGLGDVVDQGPGTPLRLENSDAEADINRCVAYIDQDGGVMFSATGDGTDVDTGFVPVTATCLVSFV